jgi:hypothetical protein
MEKKDLATGLKIGSENLAEIKGEVLDVSTDTI